MNEVYDNIGRSRWTPNTPNMTRLLMSTYRFVAIVFMLSCEHSSEEFDALLIISAKDLRLASLDECIQSLAENLHVHAMKVLFFGCLSLDEFV